MFFTTSAIGDFLICAIVAFIAIHTIFQYRKGNWLLFDPLHLFWAGVLVVYVNQPASYGDTFIGWYGESVFEEALFWIFIGLIFVAIGYKHGLGSFRIRLLPGCPPQFSPQRLACAGLLMVSLAILGYFYLFASSGGVKSWLSAGRGLTTYSEYTSIVLLLTDFLPLGVLVLLFHAAFFDVTKINRYLYWFLGGLTLLWFIYLGTRSRTIMFTMMLMAVYYLPKRKNPPVWLCVLVFTFLLVTVNFQANYRGYFKDLSFNFQEIDTNEAIGISLPIFMGGNRDIQTGNVRRGSEFGCVLSVIELVPDVVPYNYGYGNLEIFTHYFPRALWPDKIYPHIESVQGVMKESNMTSTRVSGTDLLMGPAFTFAGHWYYIFGPIGIMIGGFITGSILRLIRYIYDRNPGSEGDVILFSMLMNIGFNDAAATPMTWITTLPLTLLPVLLLFVFCDKSRSIIGKRYAAQ